MVVMDIQVGEVFKRKNWRHGVKWRVRVTDMRDDLLSYVTIEYSGKDDDISDPTEHITLIRSFLEKWERDDGSN